MRYILFLSVLWSLSGQVVAQQLVLPGDYPDPSVTRIGDTYWASATTSNWFPAYPLLRSKDLVHWEGVGNIFTTMPPWADYYFWAPEMTYENGKVYVYYTAHKKGGNLCVGVASADRPEGPYRDHGPLVCQEAGSIDGFPMRDEKGTLYLIWKEDGNSVRQPTPIWAQQMNEERTALIGEKKELFRNTSPWEANLVEGVSMIRHGGYIYVIYAAAGCCGRGCTYGTGIARAKNLLGPWEKYEKNPVLTHEQDWKCPGHGTAIEKDGKYYFLYHAYDTDDHVYTGRQGLLIEFTFTPDGWIEFVKQKAPPVQIPDVRTDDFNGENLSGDWQWSVFQNPDKELKKGRLKLGASSNAAGTFLGQKTYWADYTVDALVLVKGSDAEAGVAAIGDEKNLVGVLVKRDSVKIIRVKNDTATEVAAKPVSLKKKVHLRMQVKGGKDISFLYSTNGHDFILLNESPLDGSFLPPWDRAVRAGLVAKGVEGQEAVFDRFSLRGLKTNE